LADPVRVQRFGENKMGKMALAALGMTLIACLVFSAATEVSTALLPVLRDIDHPPLDSTSTAKQRIHDLRQPP